MPSQLIEVHIKISGAKPPLQTMFQLCLAVTQKALALKAAAVRRPILF
ncbi:MAG: hypothetical protein M3Y08_19720 [Fibrobacterota bacterium]|nr:hypothetical protein [Fibrobacterota bacterium]